LPQDTDLCILNYCLFWCTK